MALLIGAQSIERQMKHMFLPRGPPIRPAGGAEQQRAQSSGARPQTLQRSEVQTHQVPRGQMHQVSHGQPHQPHGQIHQVPHGQMHQVSHAQAQQVPHAQAHQLPHGQTYQPTQVQIPRATGGRDIITRPATKSR